VYFAFSRQVRCTTHENGLTNKMSTSGDEKLKSEAGLKFLFGGASCCTAALFTNPIDVIKTRLQIQGELLKKGQGEIKYKGFFRGFLRIWKDEGLGGLYKGLPASLLREASYSTIRMGGYDVMKELLGATNPAATPLWKKIVAGATSGAIGSAIANPTDLVKVRFQAEGPTQSLRYRNTLHAFVEIFKTEGLSGLYRGVGPTTQRAALLTAAQLPSYDHSKHLLLNIGVFQRDGPHVHFT